MSQSTRISLTPNKLLTETDRTNHGNPPQVIAPPGGLAEVPREEKTLRTASREAREREKPLRRPRRGPASGKNSTGSLAGVPRARKTPRTASRGSREREKPLWRPRGGPASGKNSPDGLAGGPRAGKTTPAAGRPAGQEPSSGVHPVPAPGSRDERGSHRFDVTLFHVRPVLQGAQLSYSCQLFI